MASCSQKEQLAMFGNDLIAELKAESSELLSEHGILPFPQSTRLTLSEDRFDSVLCKIPPVETYFAEPMLFKYTDGICELLSKPTIPLGTFI